LFRRLRQLAERSEYFRSELRQTMYHQTFFLPNDQAFSSFGSSLNFLFDQSLTNNINDVNDVKFSFWFFQEENFFFFYSLSNHIFCH
jgi:hypothetical protein